MNKLNQNGSGSVGLIVGLILSILLLLGAAGFGIWAFTSRQDYKNNTDQKVAAAVKVAKEQEASAKDKEFLEKEKNPYRTWVGSEAYGSISITYPKTWSVVLEDNNQAVPVDAYFHPSVVPSIANQASTFGLRVSVLDKPYSEVLKTLTQLQKNAQKPLTITPYTAPKQPKTVGVRVEGNLPNQKTGHMVVLTLRSQTLQVWTEGADLTGDFNNIILPNFNFVP